VKGSGVFIPLIAGEFDGDSSSDGKGWVELRFDNFRVLQMADGTAPDGTMHIDYDRVGDPRTTDLSLETNGFGVVQFNYGYAGYADGSGAFDYAFRNLVGDRLEAHTSYDDAGAGRLRVQFTAAAGGTGSFNQCWNAAGCLVYVDDVYNFTQSCGSAPCLVGTTDDCATVPAAPF